MMIEGESSSEAAMSAPVFNQSAGQGLLFSEKHQP